MLLILIKTLFAIQHLNTWYFLENLTLTLQECLIFSSIGPEKNKENSTLKGK